MRMLVRFIQSNKQREAKISASIQPILSTDAIKFKSTNSVNVALLEKQGIEVGEEVLVDVTENKVTYPRKNGEMVTEWQLTVSLVSRMQKIIDKFIDKMDVDGSDVTFASPVSTSNGNGTPKSFNNEKLDTTKILLPEAEYQAKLAELGNDTAAIAEFTSKHDVQF